MDVTDIKQACESHYGLSDTPFSLTPDTGFYVGLESHDEAFDSVRYALAAGEGFIKVTGEVGTGKTLLCRRLLNHLESEKSDTAYIPNPTLSPTALWLGIGDELGLSGHSRLSQLRSDIQRYLLNIAQEGRRLVLVIDEAQCLPPETLEALRLISNLETERQKLVQIVLFGQPELDDILSEQRFRQLRQRITTSAHIEALRTPESVSHYLNHRLVCAGYCGEPLFTRGAVRFLWITSGGTPRLVNVLAAKSLLVAFGQGSKAIHAQHVEKAAADTESIQQPIGWHERLKLVIGL